MPTEQLMRRVAIRKGKGDFVERNLLRRVRTLSRNLARKQVSFTFEVLFVAHPQQLSAQIPHSLDSAPTNAKLNRVSSSTTEL
jgi:hypothetical protein